MAFAKVWMNLDNPFTKRDITLFHLCGMPALVRFMDTEGRMLVASQWAKGSSREPLFSR